MKIEQLITSISTAIQQTHNFGELNSMDSFLKRYFDIKKDNEHETYIPKTVNIELPSDDKDAGKVILTPMAALVHHNSVNIDYVKLNLNINVEDENSDGIHVTSQYTNSNAIKGNTGAIEIMFRCSDTPEGIARVETQLNSVI